MQQRLFHAPHPSQALINAVQEQILDRKTAQITLAEGLIVSPQPVGDLTLPPEAVPVRVRGVLAA